MASNQEKILEIISEELCVPLEDIKEESRLVEDLDADSLDHVELAMALEEAFEIALPEDKMEGVTTIAEVIAVVEKTLKKSKKKAAKK